MANNFLKQLLNVVETGKLQGVTNIKDLYNTGFANSGISYKDFKKQMHDYKIYGNLGKNDMARLSGMYYGSKNADFQEGRKAHMIDRDNGSLVYKDSNLAITPTLSLTITPLNIPVTKPVILKTVVKSTPKNNSNKQLIAEVTKVVVPSNSEDPNTYPTQELDNFYIDPEWFKDWYGAFSFNSNPQGLILPNSVKRFNEILMKNNYKGHLVTADEMRKLDNWNEIYNMIKYNNPHAKLYQNTTSKYPAYLKYGGNLNKFQQGGKTSSQQDAVMQFVKALAQTLQADPQLVIQAALENPEALKSAVQVYQESKGDIQKAAQAFSLALQSKAQAAKHGAKLNYLKSLKNKCAEDEELYYFKKGGSVGCGCRKKGGEIKEEKKESAIDKFKKMAKGDKIPLKLTVNKNDTIHTTTGPKRLVDKKETIKYPKFDHTKATQAEKDRASEKDYYRGDKDHGDHDPVAKDCGGSKMKLKKGDKVKSAGAGCIAKFKMHKLGGSLNEIPFYQKGTTERGIKLYPEDEFSGWDLVPFVGTARDIRRAYHNPNVLTIGTAAVSTAADIIGGGMLGAFGKGLLKSAKFAKKLKRLGYVPITENGNTYFKIGTKMKTPTTSSINIEPSIPTVSVHNIPAVDYTPVVNTMIAPVGRVSNYALWGVPTLK